MSSSSMASLQQASVRSRLLFSCAAEPAEVAVLYSAQKHAAQVVQ